MGKIFGFPVLDERRFTAACGRMVFSLLALLWLFFQESFVYGVEDFSLELETEAQYAMQAGVSDALAEQVALYDAKYKAVEMAARYLARRNLIDPYDRDREEIFSLAARKIHVKVLENGTQPGKIGTIWFVRIRARVRPSDFFAADVLDEKLEQEDEKKTFLQEMEPSLSKTIDPGNDIAEAFRLIHEEKWRMVIIYLDRLEKKYPGWSEIYRVKALGYYALNDTENFTASLEKACALGNDDACQELKSFIKIHDRSLQR